ncbi:MAG: hypothetical protein K2I30_01080 [Clostridia bacterium]|nr:hypothetical protein [Clostridia bacterium]
MAEERLIDDDKDRKYKIRKNADGEDELYIDDTPDEDEDVILPVFAVPYDDEDDEDAATLTPEQFAERERIKREEKEARDKKVAALCAESQEKLLKSDFEGALYAAAQAEDADPKCGKAYCLKLKALSRNFTDYTAVEQCREAADGVREYADGESKSELKNSAAGLKNRIEEVKAEADVLSEKNEAAKAERRATFKADAKRAMYFFIAAAVPFAVLAILTIVFACNMFANEQGAFLIATIVCGALTAVALIFAALTARRFALTSRRLRLNERDNSTKLGREYKNKAEELESLNAIYNSFDI